MSSLLRFPIRIRVAVELLAAKYIKPRMFFRNDLDFCVAGLPMQSSDEVTSNSLSDLINGNWLMAAPKSKVRRHTNIVSSMLIILTFLSTFIYFQGYQYEEEEKAH